MDIGTSGKTSQVESEAAIRAGGAFFFLGKKEPEQVGVKPKVEKLVAHKHHYVRFDTITVTLFQGD